MCEYGKSYSNVLKQIELQMDFDDLTRVENGCLSLRQTETKNKKKHMPFCLTKI